MIAEDRRGEMALAWKRTEKKHTDFVAAVSVQNACIYAMMKHSYNENCECKSRCIMRNLNDEVEDRK